MIWGYLHFRKPPHGKTLENKLKRWKKSGENIRKRSSPWGKVLAKCHGPSTSSTRPDGSPQRHIETNLQEGLSLRCLRHSETRIALFNIVGYCWVHFYSLFNVWWRFCQGSSFRPGNVNKQEILDQEFILRTCIAVIACATIPLYSIWKPWCWHWSQLCDLWTYISPHAGCAFMWQAKRTCDWRVIPFVRMADGDCKFFQAVAIEKSEWGETENKGSGIWEGKRPHENQ